VPVLLVLGANDNLVGDPDIAKTLVEDVPQIQVAVVETGHLLGVEHPEEVNTLIIDFFEQR
jgi:pimeloyl-ACP methyl ester carboxylesterase